MKTTLDIAALASAVLYPLVLLIIFFLFRKEIPGLLKSISGRLTKLEFAGVSLELAKAEAFSPNWISEGIIDLRKKAKAENVIDSTAGNFSTLLEAGGSVDYVIINLGQGNEWLASRLFIMSIIFEKMKGIKGVVFLETTPDTRKKFVGWANPQKVRWALAIRFPWFEKAYATAYANLAEQGVKIVSNQGSLGYSDDLYSSRASIELLEYFLRKIQAPPEIPPLPEQEIDWINLPSDPLNPIFTQEHTRWLNAEDLDGILGEVLVTESIKSEKQDSPNIEKKIKKSLMTSLEFIAVVKDDYGFEYLVKREKLLEQMLTD